MNEQAHLKQREALLSPQQRKQQGLALLLGAARSYQELSKAEYPWEIPTTLKDHPFNLPIPEKVRLNEPFSLSTYDFFGKGIRFIGVPGVTETSMSPMIAFIAREMLERGFVAGGKPVYLRVIFAECDPANRKHHDVYYEIGFQFEVFLCGGCTDCSGEGGFGKLRMDSLFALLSDIFGLEIQRVTIPYEQAEKVRRALSDAEYAKTQWFKREWRKA